MDPNEYAMSYDQRIRKTLDSNSALNKIKNQILDRCLAYRKKDLGEEEMKCIENQYKFIQKYLEKANNLE